MKRCSKCKKNKPKSEFRSVNYGDGSWDYQAWCNECHGEFNLDKRCGNGATEYRKKKFSEQGGLCAICGKPEVENKKKMALDCNHETGEWRGLICNECSLKMGWTEKHLYKILKYLEEYK